MKKNTSKTILPCPFCGSPGELVVVSGGAMNGNFRVECSSSEKPACKMKPSTNFYKKQSKAIKAWNQRPKPKKIKLTTMQKLNDRVVRW